MPKDSRGGVWSLFSLCHFAIEDHDDSSYGWCKSGALFAVATCFEVSAYVDKVNGEGTVCSSMVYCII